MLFRAIVLLCVPLSAATAFAQTGHEPDQYSVRNDTGRSFSCGLRWEPRRHVDRFVLVRGTAVVRPARGGSRRSLICDSQPKHLQRFIMRPGVRYQLVQHQGVVDIRPLPDQSR